MPTIYRLGSIKIVIYPKDHHPAHVHVIGKDAEAKFEISTLKLISNYGFSAATVRLIREFLESRKERLMEKWNDYQE